MAYQVLKFGAWIRRSILEASRSKSSLLFSSLTQKVFDNGTLGVKDQLYGRVENRVVEGFYTTHWSVGKCKYVCVQFL